MATVELKNVSKIYSENVKAVDNINLKIEDKEFLVLVGPSGCGKSTTLRMVAGLESISTGEMFIDEKLVNDIQPKDRDIALVFQNYALYPHMTVFDNIAFGLKLRKIDKNEIQKRVKNVSDILELSDLLNRKPKALSGGQRQRVALGRAIVRNPKVFLFDEPLSNLDAKLRVQMRTEISKLHQKLGVTMIYVTHDQTEAMTMGDRIVVMKDGSIQQVDTPLNLYRKPVNTFVAGFIGTPSMNFIEGKFLINNGLEFNSLDESFVFLLPEKYIKKLENWSSRNIKLGIRPESFSYEPNHDDSVKIKIKISVFEPMGNESFLYFNLGGKEIVSRVPGIIEQKVGNEIDLYINADNLYFFDELTGNTIYV
ncbi:MAG: sn-glycerol-3-phosphate ABC transporter ATP-binding protein UgpC [Bacteroidetes bacterium]|nr:sn-glycerol-3-phosphate ABC transporter ATP-binding protein UgpC [Bacteroidota bacterium]MBU1114791.1 sn-glycerol-3-phosphate ABC transporter ATP-binding protein UgpC [Bacteroidota bacterium]MBU1797872.1 sn-glycerol-3-phosphate ABC transporter ATP-binding protein UgpC [Bacteroidota bacterium]